MNTQPVRSPRRAQLRVSLLTLAIVSTAVGCEREARRLDERMPHGPQRMIAQGVLQPGPTLVADTVEGPYDDNAYGVSEGQTLFDQMNCSGCHANGGGGMGPALMDDEWIYGSRPDQIFATIAEGRPNGMPTWKYRLNDQQIWELVAYVRSLSGLTPKGARSNRTDHMMVKPAASQTPNAKPKNSPTAGPPR
jgi:cytochrome c oxidase cbb3-type subunit 3